MERFGKGGGRSRVRMAKYNPSSSWLVRVTTGPVTRAYVLKYECIASAFPTYII